MPGLPHPAACGDLRPLRTVTAGRPAPTGRTGVPALLPVRAGHAGGVHPLRTTQLERRPHPGGSAVQQLPPASERTVPPVRSDARISHHTDGRPGVPTMLPPAATDSLSVPAVREDQGVGLPCSAGPGATRVRGLRRRAVTVRLPAVRQRGAPLRQPLRGLRPRRTCHHPAQRARRARRSPASARPSGAAGRRAAQVDLVLAADERRRRDPSGQGVGSHPGHPSGAGRPAPHPSPGPPA